MFPDLTTLRRRLQVGPVEHRTALTEAAVLYRSVARPLTGTTRPSRGGLPGAPVGILEPGTLTSFDTAAAAARFARVVRHGTGVTPQVQSRTFGIRHRHEMHFIHLDDTSRDTVLTAMADAWRSARITVRPVPSGGAAGTTVVLPGVRYAPVTAVAIWRALLLATTPVRNAAGLRLRIRDAELLALAVRSAQLLGVRTRARSSSGLGLVCVDEPEQVNRLLSRLVTRVPAMRRVPTLRPGGRPVASGAGRRPAPVG